MDNLGQRFARSLASKDFDGVASLLHPEIDFRGLTPRRTWEASEPEQVVDGILRQWFEDSDEIDELVSVETGAVADRQRVAYLLRGHNGDGPFVVEQQAYYAERDGRIDWMRVLCSGFRAP
ncbi:MAG TPA: hypothetical protein VH834_07565 [Solirubrobacteraceae bacterium]|jgi:hypothetical protein